MRRAAALAVLAVAAAFAAAGCGGPPVDDVRTVAPFDRLDVTGGIAVQLMRGERTGVTVHGRKDVIDRVTTSSSGGRLHIGVHDRGIVIGSDPMDDVVVRITAPSLRDVSIEGRGDVDLGNVHAGALRFKLTGAGDVTARGQVDTLTASIYGAGSANFRELQARNARLVINGASQMTVHVDERLSVLINGAGDVRYTGTPVVSKQINGAGDVLPATAP